MKAFLALLVAVAAVAGSSASGQSPVPPFRHVIVIVFENKEASAVLGDASAPTFNSYAHRYADLTEYYAVTHPSLPNYLALVSGSTQGITENCTSCIVDADNLAVALAAARRTWKTYAEGLPTAGFTGATSGRYAKKHNPFLYFRNVASRPALRRRVVPLPVLARDLRAKRLPDFALVVPDLCHSMHDCSVAVGDAWLRRLVPPLLKLQKTGIFVLFDEGTTNAHGGGHVPALVLGTAVRPRSTYADLTGHYGVLRTIEDAWGLRRLGHSTEAAPITEIWR